MAALGTNGRQTADKNRAGRARARHKQTRRANEGADERPGHSSMLDLGAVCEIEGCVCRETFARARRGKRHGPDERAGAGEQRPHEQQPPTTCTTCRGQSSNSPFTSCMTPAAFWFAFWWRRVENEAASNSSEEPVTSGRLPMGCLWVTRGPARNRRAQLLARAAATAAGARARVHVLVPVRQGRFPS